MLEIKGNSFKILFSFTPHSLAIDSGNFGEISIAPSSLFYMRAKSLIDGKNLEISSESNWNNVEIIEKNGDYIFKFTNPCKIPGISVNLLAKVSENNIRWTGSVTNESDEWSVMEITYPRPLLYSENFDLFVPMTSGIVIKNAGMVGYEYTGGQGLSMQYFAVFSNDGGLYFGIHDPAPALKRYHVRAKEKTADLKVYYVGDNGNVSGNSFVLSGECVWQKLSGDWYDASKIYADFVRNKAEWIPKIDKSGRDDTAEKFKDVPFWVCDYIPNSPSQGDNRPMKLSAGSDLYTPGYWYNAVIELQRELDVPIGYHVYNWHEIPFNVDYPHFMPAKKEFITGLRELKKHDIYVTPYINALSWETRDSFSGKFDMTFENTGKAGSVKLEDGNVRVAPYPQTHGDGIGVDLANMCPTYKTWHKIIKDVAEKMEKTLDIDGIYFDQISAFHGAPCYDKSHGHTLGGGRYWCDGYRQMMQDIIKNKPNGTFYFSEDNTEEFMNLFDGFLTWRWLMNEEVPAFPAVYSGYIQMLGRNVLGTKKEDIDFFKHTLAKSFVYGQQLGWIKADVIYSKDKLPFLKKLVQCRYKYRDVFRCAEMLRPPRTKCSLEPKVTTPAMHYTSDVVIEQVYSGAWKQRGAEKIVIFVVNSATKECEYSVSFDNNEYGIREDALISRGFKIDSNGTATIKEKLSPESVKAFEF